MRRRVLQMTLVRGLFLAASGARPAHAESRSGWDPETMVIVSAVLAIDVAFTAVDLVGAIREWPLPKGCGVAELFLTAPQTVLLAPRVAETFRLGKPEPWILIMIGWTVTLAGHGVWTMFRPHPPEPPRERTGQARLLRRVWGVSHGVLGAPGVHPRPVAGMVLAGRF